MKKIGIAAIGFFGTPLMLSIFVTRQGALNPIRFLIDRLRAGNFDRAFMDGAVFLAFISLLGAAAFLAIFDFLEPKVLSEEELMIQNGKLLIREEIRRVQAKGAIEPRQADRIWSKLSARFVAAMRRR